MATQEQSGNRSVTHKLKERIKAYSDYTLENLVGLQEGCIEEWQRYRNKAMKNPRNIDMELLPLMRDRELDYVAAEYLIALRVKELPKTFADREQFYKTTAELYRRIGDSIPPTDNYVVTGSTTVKTLFSGNASRYNKLAGNCKVPELDDLMPEGMTALDFKNPPSLLSHNLLNTIQQKADRPRAHQGSEDTDSEERITAYQQYLGKSTITAVVNQNGKNYVLTRTQFETRKKAVAALPKPDILDIITSRLTPEEQQKLAELGNRLIHGDIDGTKREFETLAAKLERVRIKEETDQARNARDKTITEASDKRKKAMIPYFKAELPVYAGILGTGMLAGAYTGVLARDIADQTDPPPQNVDQQDVDPKTKRGTTQKIRERVGAAADDAIEARGDLPHAAWRAVQVHWLGAGAGAITATLLILSVYLASHQLRPRIQEKKTTDQAHSAYDKKVDEILSGQTLETAASSQRS